jgi:quercetin dioxygenase-like cupin family protein
MSIDIVETNRLKDFSPDAVRSTPLLDAGKVRALLLNLGAGQSVAPCQMSATVLYYVVEGQGHLRVADEQAELHAGSVAVVPAGAVRSISAAGRMRVLAVQAL